jgi:hypothetical protein
MGVMYACVCMGVYVCAHIHVFLKNSCIKNYIRNKCMGQMENAYNMLVVICKGKRPLAIGICT